VKSRTAAVSHAASCAAAGGRLLAVAVAVAVAALGHRRGVVRELRVARGPAAAGQADQRVRHRPRAPRQPCSSRDSLRRPSTAAASGTAWARPSGSAGRCAVWTFGPPSGRTPATSVPRRNWRENRTTGGRPGCGAGLPSDPARSAHAVPVPPGTPRRPARGTSRPAPHLSRPGARGCARRSARRAVRAPLPGLARRRRNVSIKRDLLGGQRAAPYRATGPPNSGARGRARAAPRPAARARPRCRPRGRRAAGCAR
jgi:hypothetical protein